MVWSECVNVASQLGGLIGVAVIPRETRSLLAWVGDDSYDISPHIARLATAVSHGSRLCEQINDGRDPAIEDMVLTGRRHYHIIRVCGGDGAVHPPLILCLVLERKSANLALARLRLKEMAQSISERAEEMQGELTPRETSSSLPELEADTQTPLDSHRDIDPGFSEATSDTAESTTLLPVEAMRNETPPPTFSTSQQSVPQTPSERLQTETEGPEERPDEQMADFMSALFMREEVLLELLSPASSKSGSS